MSYDTDYAKTRAALKRVLTALERAQLATARTNLPPKMPISGARAQVDDLQRAIEDAMDELEGAREACIEAGRRGLKLCD